MPRQRPCWLPVFSCGPTGLADACSHGNRGTPGHAQNSCTKLVQRYVTCTKMVHDYVQCTTMVHAYVMCTNMVHAPTWCALAWCVHWYGAWHAMPWGEPTREHGTSRGGMHWARTSAGHGAARHGMIHAWGGHACGMPWHSMARAVSGAGGRRPRRWHGPCMAQHSTAHAQSMPARWHAPCTASAVPLLHGSMA
jgi:hypothetical protein